MTLLACALLISAIWRSFSRTDAVWGRLVFGIRAGDGGCLKGRYIEIFRSTTVVWIGDHGRVSLRYPDGQRSLPALFPDRI